MAANRKLQAEIDRCLKKVAEGVEKFEETWQKVHNASNTNQKEKYEEDLKKEIKKLQRLRDQIKTWIASGSINDKSILMEKRKLIEMQMERFKVVEKETKTKAYSKEGLTSGSRLDPAERERAEISQWLNQCLDTLNIQIDSFEAEIESLNTSKKKKNRNENAEAIEECQRQLEKHREHVLNLETLLRMLDNDAVNIGQIKNIQEDVEYYIENCQEPDFAENELVYEDIDGLEDMLMELSSASVRHEVRESEEPEEAGSITLTTADQLSLQNSRDKSTGPSGGDSQDRADTASIDSNSASSPPPSSTANYLHNQHPSSNDIESGLSSSSLSNSKRRHKSSSDDGKTRDQSGSSTPSGLGPSSTSSILPASSSPSSTPTPNNSNLTSSSSNHVAASSILESGGVGDSTSSSSKSNNNNNAASSSAAKTVPSSVISQQNCPLAASTTGGVSGSATSGKSVNNNSSAKFGHSVNTNSSPNAGSVPNHVAGSAASSAASSPAIITTGTAQPNFAAAVQQLNGHASSMSEGNSSIGSSVGSNVPQAAVSIDPSSSIINNNGLSALIASSAPSSSLSTPPISASSLTNSKAANNSSVGSMSSLQQPGGQLRGGKSVDGDVSSDGLPTLKTMAQEALSSTVNQNNHPAQIVASTASGLGGLSVSTAASISQSGLFTSENGSVNGSKLMGVSNRGGRLEQQHLHQTEANIPPLLGVAPLGPVPLTKDTRFQYQMLEAAFSHMPHPSDSERLRPYLPRNPCPTPPYYPQLPPQGSDTLEFFQRLSTETLFFIFYYMEGTKAQYLAAKALKKQSWRFHTKYMMWFQRHEEPKLINDEFEQGTYIYFDFEKWGQRKKEGFTFEYRFLEDRDLQ
eukprot:maker-scaffold75_size407189-snap-gene-2.15 protein:Tk10129 transcript:maker-scaffold75_size407189-snap-gene-2.15-mRNA-1 annotation:"ccr4-not transcription complex subunit 3-like"